MNPDHLARLKQLRDSREGAARRQLAEANRAVDEAVAIRDQSIIAARELEAGLDRRNRDAVDALLREGTDRLALTRLTLQYRIGQDELLGALRKASADNATVATRQAEAETRRQHWSGEARAAKKVERMQEHLSVPPASGEGA